jgi:hypothetical protein
MSNRLFAVTNLVGMVGICVLAIVKVQQQEETTRKALELAFQAMEHSGHHPDTPPTKSAGLSAAA